MKASDLEAIAWQLKSQNLHHFGSVFLLCFSGDTKIREMVSALAEDLDKECKEPS